MNLPGFSALSAAWLFALLGPLILFYFLKLRRPRVEIPSLALWQQVISDQRVNSPFQRFKRNMLLLLQILLLCALTLGAMQPYWPATGGRAQFIPVLIDTSASMAALDRAGGETRLDAAKREARKIIDNLLPDQRACLIAVDSTARRLTDFTDNARVLGAALDQLQIRPVSSRLEDGLRMAQALARTEPVKSVVLISDGNLPPTVDFELPFRLNYQRLPAAGLNVGITDFNARRTKDGWDVFVRLDGSGAESGETSEKPASRLVEVSLIYDGQVLQRESVGVAPGETARLTFPVNTTDAAELELKIVPDGFDSLAADNVAYIDLPEPRSLMVFCPPELGSYRQALSALADVDLYPQEGKSTPEFVDLRFSDQPLNAGPAARVSILTGIVPEELSALVKLETKLAEVIDWNRTAPILQHVQLLDVQIADDPVSAAGVGERDYELAGWEVLAQGGRGPLILEKTSHTGVTIAFLFHTDRSSLPYRVGFPILVANAAEVARNRAALSEARSWPTGILPPQHLSPETEYVLTAPDGHTEATKSNAEGIAAGLTADQAGRYLLKQGDKTVATWGVSLLAPNETGLKTVEKLLFPETSVSTATQMVQTDRPLWGWFAIAGLALLLGEWWYFQKRPSGVPV